MCLQAAVRRSNDTKHVNQTAHWWNRRCSCLFADPLVGWPARRRAVLRELLCSCTKSSTFSKEWHASDVNSLLCLLSLCGESQRAQQITGFELRSIVQATPMSGEDEHRGVRGLFSGFFSTPPSQDHRSSEQVRHARIRHQSRPDGIICSFAVLSCSALESHTHMVRRDALPRSRS